jgi:hypothetical protein
MSRDGMNPLRLARLEPLPSTVAAVIVHIPEESGYHANRREVVQTCIDSMDRFAGRDHNLLIWSNGCSTAIIQWLQKRYKQATIIISPNIGKSNARAAIFGMLPDDTMINMSDDDMLYYPDWLAKLAEVYDHFPNVGVVSGYPVRTAFRWGCKNTIEWGHIYGKIFTGRYIPDEYDRDFCTSIGRDYEWHIQYTANDRDTMLAYEGMKVLATGHHCQFYGNVGKLRKYMQRTVEAMADEKPLDIAIDNAKLLRLTTMTRYSRHIGNLVDEGITAEVIKYGL